MTRRTVLVALIGFALVAAVTACGGSGGGKVSAADKTPTPSDLGGCSLTAFVADSPARSVVHGLTALLQRDPDAKAFEYVSRRQLLKDSGPHLPGENTSTLRSHFTVFPAGGDGVTALRSRLVRQSGVTRLTSEGCPILAHESGSKISTVSTVVSAFRAEGFSLQPFKPPKGTPIQIIPSTAGVVLELPGHGPFFVFVGASVPQAHSIYKQFTDQLATGTFDLRQGNVYVSGSDLTREQQARVKAAIARLSP